MDLPGPGDSSARRSKSKAPRQGRGADRGKLRIGDDWNAIRIIALSQGNPLKAIAEFVENSIDARAKTVTITRGREHGEHYLSIKDDGDGVPRDEEGRPNFKYVATHIGDSVKRRLTAEGSGNGIQGEFGIGLLSFWTVVDKVARKQYEVEPRAYEGQLLHQLPAVRTPFGDAYAELYLAEPADSCRVALTRAGTRVIEDLATLPGLEHAPWSSRYLQGLVDVPFLSLTPGTRTGIIHDERYAALLEAMQALEAHLQGLIEAQERAQEEQASQQSLRAIQRAFREALLALPPEEYDWFDIQALGRNESGLRRPGGAQVGSTAGEREPGDLGVTEPAFNLGMQRHFFDYAGPLFSVVISPASSTTPVNARRRFRALPRDRSRRRVEEDLQFSWEIAEGGGSLAGTVDQEVEYLAPATPGLARLNVSVTQHDVTCTAEALITITASLEATMSSAIVNARGLPGYTFERAAGERRA